MNMFKAGSDLLNTMRPGFAGHRVVLCRGNSKSNPFYASSPPAGHQVLTLSGLELSEHDKVFYWALKDCDLGDGKPRRGDVILDEWGQKWTVRPSEERQESWHWHGQNQDAVGCMARRDN